MWHLYSSGTFVGREPGMTADPTDPQTFEKDEDVHEGEEEFDVEAPRVDAAEQQTEVAPESDDPVTDLDPARANEADLLEQARVVALDEDDYR